MTGYQEIFENGKLRVTELAEDEAKVTEVITSTAKSMSEYLKQNQRKYGYAYEERGVLNERL